MISKLLSRLKKTIQTLLGLCLCFCLIAFPFGESAQAGRTSMTGDYLKDTISVAKSLKQTVTSPESSEVNLEKDKETVFLITDYISRYRNRYQVNGSQSFTTMQTALNSLAGHYKTFPNRPVPEKLKDRLNEELSKAEELVLNKN
tara:strand:- start:32 stop:466 length:435 start_codon:yes stop_codon:yes gene_type:complete